MVPPLLLLQIQGPLPLEPLATAAAAVPAEVVVKPAVVCLSITEAQRLEKQFEMEIKTDADRKSKGESIYIQVRYIRGGRREGV